METSLIRSLYEQFLDHMSGRMVRIDYDARHDTLYAFGEQPWSAHTHEKPRTVSVASGIHLDVQISTNQIYGVEIEDFDSELRETADTALLAWWEHVRADSPHSVEGARLAQALQRATFAL